MYDVTAVLTANFRGADADLILILHAHIPYIRHPEAEHHLEENWLFEAITESYLPLIDALHRLLDDSIEFRLTFSLTPSLLEMLGDALLRDRYRLFLDRQLDLADREVFRTAGDPAFGPLAEMYRRQLLRMRRLFENTLRGDLIAAFGALRATGSVELMTSAATHAYLPAHVGEPAAARAQISVGADCFRRLFGSLPRGFWLPECGYSPEIDRGIREAGLRFFVLEAHGLLSGLPRPKKSIYAPVRTPAGSVVFGRDVDSAGQVWSSLSGYPGDPFYREFYRDIGFDLDYDYVRPWLPGGVRTFTGFKYFRVTGQADLKEPYDPARAEATVHEHARHFLRSRLEQAAEVRAVMTGSVPVITAAYDAELFGHWWFEGPAWIESVFRHRPQGLRFVTPSEYLARHRCHEMVSPAVSSWGKRGFHEVWVEPKNAWIYRHLGHAARLMRQAAEQHSRCGALTGRALNQAGRELLLAQASDWPFMMHTGNAAAFAEQTLRGHIGNFFTLINMAESAVDEQELSRLEEKNRIFPFLDFRVFAGDAIDLGK